MILRRFTKHINDQNWFAVGLDVIVVMVGIFFGLQVQSWNEGRLERAEEHQYLGRLHDDITSSISRNTGNVEFLKRQGNYTRIMLDDLSKCQMALDHAYIFANGLFSLGKLLPPALSRTVMDELNATGKTLIIRSVELRSALAEHEVYLNETVIIDDKIVLRTMPHIIKIDNKFVFNLSGLNLAMTI
ncbi:MAG: hypothetical protein JKX72_07685 [Robiginitomaculum sp.]|nr:hypothetical protein [Robiginitomaculum sp.]